MATEWIRHDSHIAQFRQPFGAVAGGSRVWLTVQVARPPFPDAVLLRVWQDGVGETLKAMTLATEDTSGHWYTTELSVPPEPGWLWYSFQITVGERLYFYGDNAEGLGGEGQLYEQNPPSYQITVYRPGTVTPHWFKHAVMYQIFPDRFYRTAGEYPLKPGSVLQSHWENTPGYVRDVDSGRMLAYDFFGGNLRGIQEKLPYLKELGITVLYLNPIFSSVSNHRYDTADYKTVDALLGGDAAFRELCEAAEAAGIRLILDGVFSHTGDDSRYFNRYGRYPDIGACQSPASPYYTWYRFHQYPHSYEAWWGIDTLPNVEEMEPSYRDFIIRNPDSVIRHWLRQGAKGWRLDVADELPDEFIVELRQAMQETDREAVLIGEVWEDASRKESYGVLRRYLQGDELDSVMNYPFRSVLLDFALGRQDAFRIHRLLMSLYENYPRHHFYALMNLIGSHDVPRALTVLGEAPDDLKGYEQAVHRLSPAARRLAGARLKMLALWQMTFPGVPCVYYGDEAGVEGFKDPYNRRTYPWGREDGELLGWYRQVIALRHQHAFLRTGEWISLPLQPDIYGYIRVIQGGRDALGEAAADGAALVLFNRHPERRVTLQVAVRPWCHGFLKDVLGDGGEYPVQQGLVSVQLEPLEGKLLIQQERDALPRQAGLLLHPTSLPSPYGIGDLGQGAAQWLQFLRAAKQSLWQVLPLQPVGYGESPYQCLSAFAGNPLLISPDLLQEAGWLTPAECAAAADVLPAGPIYYAQASRLKYDLLQAAFQRFQQAAPPTDFTAFCEAQKWWLDDYALFMAVKTHFNGLPWIDWPSDISLRQPAAVARYRKKLQQECEYQRFLQYCFFTQWQALKRQASAAGIALVGDVPIFVAHDSCDVWLNRQLFDLDAAGRPRTVAGVPPDYFSKTGQLWGNPQYRWEEMARDDYAWWRKRLTVMLQMVDILRIDHFRGFEAFWAIPGTAKTAVRGRWVKGPGEAFFQVLERELGTLPLIVEDLGVITPEVEELKHRFFFPGIQVLQFLIGQDEHGQCRPLGSLRNCALYTGTHDNDTTVGWFTALRQEQPALADCVCRELGLTPAATAAEVCRAAVEWVYQSQANSAIVPLQDMLALPTAARMNCPGTLGDNWRWRYTESDLTPELAAYLAGLTERCQRAPQR